MENAQNPMTIRVVKLFTFFSSAKVCFLVLKSADILFDEMMILHDISIYEKAFIKSRNHNLLAYFVSYTTSFRSQISWSL